MTIRGYKYVINGLLTCISLLFLTGCQEDTVNGMSAEEGRLVIAGLSVDIGVEDVATRSSLTNVPSLSDLSIKLTDKSDESNVITLSSSTTDTVLPAGSYTLSASYGENVCGTTPYFYGSTDVEIVALSSTTTTVSASLQSAIIHPIISKSLQQQFKSFALHVKCENSEHASIVVGNDADYFVPSGKSYTLSLTGTNMIGESKDIDVYTLNGATAATRYNITCDPSLPSFTMPTQAGTNAWSTFINITPMTSGDMTSLAGLTADKVIANAVYEAISGNDTITSTKDANGNHKISGLKPGTTYTLRSRFGGVVSSNTVTLTTENGTALTNGNMESWSSTTVYSASNAVCADIVLVKCEGWATLNEKTTDGASGASANLVIANRNNNSTYWRWYSNTESASGNESTCAALSTMAFYNSNIIYTRYPSRDNIDDKMTNSDMTAYPAYLFLGTYNLSSDSYTLGISHDSRPTKLSFDCEYDPLSGDEYIVTAAVYDSNKNEIASISSNGGSTSSSWITKELEFDYGTNLSTKAAYISVFFQSGSVTDVTEFNHVYGSYNSEPFKYDKIVGSKLYIDNVKLIYE
jgi:hypothetical protein